MKLLFTQDALVNAGAERSHLEILSRFTSDIEVTLVYFYPKHDLKEAYEKAGIRLIFLEISESYHFGLAISRLVKLIRIEKPDLLISSLYRADQITRIASLITRVPLVGTLVNDSYAPLAWKDKKGLKYKLVHRLDRLTAGIPVHWIANAEALSDSHVRTLGLDASRISVVYRGRRIPSVPASAAKQSVDHSAKLETDCFVVPPRNDAGEESTFRFLSYGRLLERKGFQDAIMAFSKVVKKYPNSSLTIYGEGPYRIQLETLITKLDLTDKVLLPGRFNSDSNRSRVEGKQIATSSLGTPRNDVTTILLENHCFIFPSWYEGFSGALVEAMMVGIPIIASDIPMNLEAVENNLTALVFPVQNSKILSEKILWAINHSQEMDQIGKNARQVATSKFDINLIVVQYEQTLFQIHNSGKI
jgi:glycosyltransferase involved in cell wall biosynthesis